MRSSIIGAVLLFVGVQTSAADPLVKWQDGKEGKGIPGKVVTFEEIKDLKESAKLAWKDCWAWVAFEGFEPLMQPQKDAKPSGAKPLPFLQRANLFYSDWQSYGEVWALLAFGEIGKNLEIIGWVPMRYLVVDNRAWMDNATTLLQRAMIVNSVDNFKKDNKVDPPPMLLSLETEPEKRKKGDVFRLFNIYFIYGDTNPASENEGFLLLGSRTQFNYYRAVVKDDEKEVKDAIHGWVPKNRICRWKTREAVMWDPSPDRREPVVTYENYEEAFKAHKGLPAKAITSESMGPDKIPPVWPHRRMRYPVVSFSIRPNEPEVLEAPGLNNSLRKVGVVGNLVDGQGRLQVDQAEIEELKVRAERLQNQVDNVELLFVVDDTESMSPWFKRTAETIEKMIEAVHNDKRRKLKFGLTYFNDVPLKKGEKRDQQTRSQRLPAVNTQHSQLADADSDKAKELLKDLRIHTEQDGGDPREQVFLGLEVGIEKARFSPFARKIVILIGDCGDHDTNPGGDFKAEKDLVKRLTPEEESPIEFYALQVDDPKRSFAHTAFRDQTKKIVDLFRSKVKNDKTSGYFETTDENRLKQVILNRFEELSKEVADTKEKLRRVGMGQFELIDDLAPEIIDALKLTPEKREILKKTKGAQLFSYAFVWERNAKEQQQTRKQLMVSKKELERLHGMLKDHFASGDVAYNPSPEQIAKIVANLQGGQDDREGETGCHAGIFRAPKEDDPRKVSVQTVMKLKHGFVFKSPLLTMTVAEYENKPAKDRRLIEAQLEMCELLLDDILKAKEFQYHKKKATDPFPLVRGKELLPTVKGNQFDRSFYLHDDNKSSAWYWIDFDKEWP